ncbi:MAG: CsgG/HfaB family protein [Treponema sp.]|nr:CsgG/HfaB family protein [Treponema sp.]
MRKIFIMLLFLLFTGIVYAGNNKSLDAVISAASDKLDQGIPRDKVIAVLNIKSDSARLSDYIIDGLINSLLKTGIHKVVDRNSEDAQIIKNELNYQYSGEVNEETAQQIGYSTAAGAVVSGAVERMGESYILKIKAVSVETREILVSWNTKIADSDDVDCMLSSAGSVAAKRYAVRGFSAGAAGGIQTGINDNGKIFSDTETVFTQAGCNVKETNYTSFTGRVFIKYTRSPGFGFQTEFFYWNGGKEAVASSSSETTGAVKIKYYSFDVPVLISFSFPIVKTTVSLLAGVDLSFPQKGILYNSLEDGSTDVTSGSVLVPGFIAGIDYTVPVSSQFSILIGFRYLRDFIPYLVKKSDATTFDSALTRSCFNFDAGVQFLF